MAVRADKTCHPLSYVKVFNTPKLSMFFSWTAGTVKHSTSPRKPFFPLFISIMVAIHCQQFKLTLTVTAHTTQPHLQATRFALHLGATVTPAPQQAQLHQETRCKEPSDFWIHCIEVYTQILKNNDSLQKQCRAETQQTHAHSEPDLYHTQSFAHPTPSEVTPLSH